MPNVDYHQWITQDNQAALTRYLESWLGRDIALHELDNFMGGLYKAMGPTVDHLAEAATQGYEEGYSHGVTELMNQVENELEATWIKMGELIDQVKYRIVSCASKPRR